MLFFWNIVKDGENLCILVHCDEIKSLDLNKINDIVLLQWIRNH